MTKKIEDYLHLYLGCEVMVPDESHPCIMESVTPKSVYIESGCDYPKEEIRPILRPLSSMTGEEAEHLAWLCMNSRHHLDDESRIDKEDIDIELVFNDGGNLLDDNVEVYIGLTCRCFVGAVIIRKDGSICVEDDDGKKEPPLDDIAEKVLYLIRQAFDLFGLIAAGLAIDSTTLNPKDNG